MKKITLAAIICLFGACIKEYSGHTNGKGQTDTTTLPADYPFATGVCNGSSLDIEYPPNTDSAVTETTLPLPDSVLLNMPAAGNQGAQGSCAAWAVTYAAGSYAHHAVTVSGYADSTLLSPAYTYNQITQGNCTCTSIIDNLNLLKYQGAAPLATMQYNAASCAVQPTGDTITKAAAFKISKWAALKKQDTLLIKRLLFEKHVVIIAVQQDDAFKHLQSPFIWNEASPAMGGAHAVTITGYSDSKHAFRIMNSWSAGWADNGFAWMDYTFFTLNAEDDCYVVYQ